MLWERGLRKTMLYVKQIPVALKNNPFFRDSELLHQTKTDKVLDLWRANPFRQTRNRLIKSKKFHLFSHLAIGLNLDVSCWIEIDRSKNNNTHFL